MYCILFYSNMGNDAIFRTYLLYIPRFRARIMGLLAKQIQIYIYKKSHANVRLSYRRKYKQNIVFIESY
jgi:hypothetical protein